MNTILLISSIGMIVGFFILFKISPIEFTSSIFSRLSDKPKSIRDEIEESTRRKKPSYIRREIQEVQAILKVTNREKMFPVVCMTALLMFAVGASIAIMLGNIFLIPVMAIGFLFLPFWWIKLTASYFKKNIVTELETALSIITTAYLRSEDLLTAIEENIYYLNPPILFTFKNFVSRVKLINPDIISALQELKTQVDNQVFHEWVNALIACQHDRNLKTTLTPIVSKLSDMRVVNGELENMVFNPRKEFIIMQILVIGNIPLLYFLNKDWYNTLMHTTVGQIILAICGIVIFVSTAFVVKLTQPIEYKR